MLGIVCRRYADAVAVSGTHGKTTTTAMLTQILVQSGKDPTAIIGGKSRGGQCRRERQCKGKYCQFFHRQCPARQYWSRHP